MNFYLLFNFVGLFVFTGLLAQNSSDELIAAYREAHKEKDLSAVLALYYWQGVDEKVKNSVTSNQKRYLDYKIIDIKISKAAPRKYKPFILNGKRYITTLEVTEVLKINFTNGLSKEVTIPVGQKSGKYYFVTARPE